MARHLADVMDEHGLVDEALAIARRLWGSDDQHVRDVADVYYYPVLWDLRRISSDGRDMLVAQMRSRADAELSSTNPRRAGRAYYNLAQTLNASTALARPSTAWTSRSPTTPVTPTEITSSVNVGASSGPWTVTQRQLTTTRALLTPGRTPAR
jgi:hypothetical protein